MRTCLHEAARRCRAFVRQADSTLLDQPTGATGNRADVAWRARFCELIRGRTAVIIAHDVTTAMPAGVIRVMDRGRIVESGSHAGLFDQSGGDADSWRDQVWEARPGVSGMTN